jgi:hypothetical protein
MPKADAKFKVGDLVQWGENHILSAKVAALSVYVVTKVKAPYVYVHHLDLADGYAMMHEDDFEIYSAVPRT